jgi:hypothetical protein
MFTDTQARPVSGRYYPLTFAQLVHRAAGFPAEAHGCRTGNRIRAHLRNSLVETVHGHQLCTLAPKRYLAVLSLPDTVPVALGRRALERALECMIAFGEPDPLHSRADWARTFYRAFLGPLGRLTMTRDVTHWDGFGWGPCNWGQVIALSRRYRRCLRQEVIVSTTLQSRRLWR